jgi:hypothetical protein
MFPLIRESKKCAKLLELLKRLSMGFRSDNATIADWDGARIDPAQRAERL